MGHRYKRNLLLTVTTLAVSTLSLVFAHTIRLVTLKHYFGAEQTLIAHWPERWGKSAIEQFAIHRLTPTLCRLGVLGPARVQVEGGISFLLDPRDLIAVSILRGGEWQPEIWDALLPALSEGAVFLDVGAHIGYFSMKASAKVGSKGRIVAFEPNPETLKLLRDNIVANNAGNVLVEPIACTDREQTLTLWAAASFNTGMASLARENADISYEEPPRPYSVAGRPIDDVVLEINLPYVNAIKIDVEGAEVQVLRGAMKTLTRFHPRLIVEIDSRQLASFKTTPEEVFSVIKEAGYNHGRPLDPGGSDWEWTMR